MPTLFFSYSHQDERLRDLLEVHLAALKRQGVISTWHDRRISAGTELGNAIDQNLNEADVILLLISPDFINSDYCYEREMLRAMERHDRLEARVIPIILRPCDWHSLPFGKLLAAPKDGKPVTKWADQDDAFLDIVTAIKDALKELGKASPSASSRRTESSAPPQAPRHQSVPATSEFVSSFPISTETPSDTKDSTLSPSSSKRLCLRSPTAIQV